MNDSHAAFTQEQMDQMREVSGKVSHYDPLASFIYELCRDHLPVGTVESTIQNSLFSHRPGFGPELDTNGWLAKYALYCSQRLKNATPRVSGSLENQL